MGRMPKFKPDEKGRPRYLPADYIMRKDPHARVAYHALRRRGRSPAEAEHAIELTSWHARRGGPAREGSAARGVVSPRARTAGGEDLSEVRRRGTRGELTLAFFERHQPTSVSRQLCPAADMATHEAMSEKCHGTNPLTRERAAREARPVGNHNAYQVTRCGDRSVSRLED